MNDVAVVGYLNELQNIVSLHSGSIIVYCVVASIMTTTTMNHKKCNVLLYNIKYCKTYSLVGYCGFHIHHYHYLR